MMNIEHVSSKERITGSSMVLCSGKLRPVIEKYLLSDQAVPTNISNPCIKHISGLDIDKHGVIRMKNNQYAISLVFEPKKTGAKILWTCKGSPKEYLPRRCSGKP